MKKLRLWSLVTLLVLVTGFLVSCGSPNSGSVAVNPTETNSTSAVTEEESTSALVERGLLGQVLISERVESINGNEWQVDGQRILVSSDTRVNPTGQPAIEVGDWVDVRGRNNRRSGVVEAKSITRLQAYPTAGGDMKVVISVDDVMPGSGLIWEQIPDGIGVTRRGRDLYAFVAHEISASQGSARISRLTLNPRTLAVEEGIYAEDGSGGYSRFCSASFLDRAVGFPTGYFIAGEEEFTDMINGRKAGVNVITSVDQSSAGIPVKELPTMGRFAHENTIGIPGFRRQVVLAGFDDSSGASELYLTVAANEDAVVNDRTNLYVFKSNVAQSGDMTPGQQITGEFVNIINPQDLSLSQMQARVNSLNAMQFVRLEDGDYIRGMDGSFFVVDTGSSSVAKCGPSRNQLCDQFGSIYRMDLDVNNPTKNAKLTLIARSDNSTWKSPDNIGVSRNTLMMNEDPADSGISRTFGRPPAIWDFPILSGGTLGSPTKVAELDNPGCGFGGTCDESSGIVDMSDYMGPGTWLFDVQAHSLRNARGGEHGQLIYFQQFAS